MKTTKRSKVATKFSKRTLAIVVVIGVAIVILLTIIITDQNRKFSMERQIETGFGLYVVDTSKLHVFNEFKNALKSGHLQYVKSQINEMINSLLRTEEIKCQHLLFSERDETAGTDAVKYLRNLLLKLGDKQLSLGETRYLLQFYFHFSCDALFSQCWFALPEVNFSKEYISKSLSKFPSFNYIITNAVEFDVLEVYEPEEIDTGNDTEKYYIIPYDLVANLRDEYQPSVLFLDEATVYHEILKNVDSTKTLVIKY